MKKRFNLPRLMLVVLGCLSFLSVSSTSEAQRRARGRESRYTKIDVDRLIKRVEENSNTFRSLYERSLSNGSLPGTEANDNLKAKIQRMDESLERLRSDFNRSDNWRDTKSQVAEVFAQARPVNRVLDQRTLIKVDLRRQWSLVKSQLNALGGVYNLPRLR